MVKRIISMLLLMVVIFSCLFAGVAEAKQAYVIDEKTHSYVRPGNYVHIEGDNINERTIESNGQVVVPDNFENGKKGKYDNQQNFDPNKEGKDCHLEDGNSIPEFPAVALPIAAVLGLVFFFQQRKNKKD